MTKTNNYLDKLHRHIKKYGTKGLLPQNLTDELLNKMNLEADAIDEERTEETPSSTLLMTILNLENDCKMSKTIEIKIAPERLMEYFSLYITTLRLEDMRRKKDIEVSDEFLPTLKNIFDKNRTMGIRWLK